MTDFRFRSQVLDPLTCAYCFCLSIYLEIFDVFGLRNPDRASFNGPIHGDVVVLNSPRDSIVLLKRVVACPGDEVAVEDGRLIVNREYVPIEHTKTGLKEDLLGKHHPVSLTFGGGPGFGPEKVPENKYLVMGDNRGHSFDGRSFGYVDRSAILGKALAIYFSDGSLVWKSL